MPFIVTFPGNEPTSIAAVGGKAFSLVRLAKAGFAMPPGSVLTTEFFAPWFEQIRATAAWAELVEALKSAPADRWADLCGELKKSCASLRMSADQRAAINDLATSSCDRLLAVRSSSPEEDLATASFAGGYETQLGVRPDDLENAVRACFASSLDERVFVYKRQHGFDVLRPTIAVIVQQQIASDVSGVGFSLNPLTNDYDETVIDANWGLGESVVAGVVSPDHFVVNKVDRSVIERTLGSKQVSIWLKPDGGTEEKSNHRADEWTLTGAQLDELTDAIVRIEELYARPMDIEWCYASGQLHVLQARPITTYVPLPEEMVTPPGARRRLYADAALSKGLTINKPVSPLGLDFMKDTFLTLLESWIGPIDHDPALDETLLFFAGGRMYMNMSNILWLSSPKKLARSSSPTDARLAEIFANIDAKTYRAAKKPPWLNLRVLWLFPKVLWRLRRFFWNTARAFAFPERARRDYQQVVVAYENRLANDVDYALPWDEFLETYYAKLMQHLFDDTMPALLVGIAGVGMVDWAVGKRSAELRVLGEQLKVGFPGNVVSQMGIDLFRLAKQLDPAEFDDLPRLAKRIEQRQMPAEFLAAWDAFEAKFGCRGPLEMDLARPRYGDDPRIALEQMSYMEMADEQFDPERTHQRQVEAREGAYDELRRRLDWPWRALLRRAHRYIELFAGTRDTPKYHNLLAYHAVRRRALMEGQKLVDAGRLDEAADVFNLTLDDLARADCDASLDLRRIGQERAAALREIGARVRQFPSVIDSRGRILRPAPRAEKPGELSGLGVSPGVVTGPVKLLHDPHEKPVDKGDILVAYTTDPGWTPLFVNAAAVVLEVGGVLQHGAVVAREYGKPCVVGIDQVMQRLRDGQQVEVDGSSGTVRVLS